MTPKRQVSNMHNG